MKKKVRDIQPWERNQVILHRNGLYVCKWCGRDDWGNATTMQIIDHPKYCLNKPKKERGYGSQKKATYGRHA